MSRYLAKENYVHDWSVERRRGHLYAELLHENENLLRNRRVLHLGCNNGSTTELLADFGADAVGLDLNPDAVDAAKRAGRWNVHVGDVLSLPEWTVGQFDTIVAFDVIEHIYPEDMPAMTGQCHDALRRGGRLLAFSPRTDPDTPSEVSQDVAHVQFFEASGRFVAPWLELFDVTWVRHETGCNANDGAAHDAWFMLLEAE